MDIDPQLGKVCGHTCHCVQNDDKTTAVIVSGGVYSTSSWPLSFRPILSDFHLGNVLYLFLSTSK